MAEVAWEKSRPHGKVTRSLRHRTYDGVSTLCGIAVPGPGDRRATAVLRGERADAARLCVVCEALDREAEEVAA